MTTRQPFDHNTEHAVLQVQALASAEREASPPGSIGHPGPSAIRVDDRLIDYMASSSGAIHLQLREAADVAEAAAAMRRARAALFKIPHPEEPDDPLPSFASPVVLESGGPTFWFDIADAEGDVLEQVLRTVTTELMAAGASGFLTTPPAS